jgi:hypothetical protein
MQKSVPEKASYSSVMEFITDCFAAHWNSILKNGIAMKLNTFKKLSELNLSFQDKNR